MKIIPQTNNVLCTLETKKEKITSSGFVYKSNDVLLYKVISIGPRFKNDINLSIGDFICTNSSGTLAKVDDREYYLFNEENITAKVV